MSKLTTDFHENVQKLTKAKNPDNNKLDTQIVHVRLVLGLLSMLVLVGMIVALIAGATLLGASSTALIPAALLSGASWSLGWVQKKL